MRSYILPGLAPSFLFVFVIFWGLVSRDSYGFLREEGREEGKDGETQGWDHTEGQPVSPAVGEPWLKGCLYHCVAAGQGAVVSAPILSLFLVYTRPSSCSFFFFKHIGFYSFIFKDFFLAALVLVVYGLSLVVQVGTALRCSAQASHHRSFSYCRAWALGTWTQ